MSVTKPIIPNEKTIETIKRIFSGKDINITNEIEIHISEKGEDCALFIIYPDHIYIEALHKCGTTTGNNLLEKFDILASEIPNMTYVRLDDDSNIQMCGREIKLYTLKILTTGQSWYNSKGYVSDNNDDQKTVNARVINMQYEEFRDKLSAQEATVIDTGNRLFPETKQKTVQDYFKYVLNDINRNIKEKGCGDKETIEKCIWLSRIINIINEMPYSIRYNRSGLVKEQLAGGTINKGMVLKIPVRYLPFSLSKNDSLKQAQMLRKSRSDYKKGKYFIRKPVKSFRSKPSNHIQNAQKIYGIEKVTPSKELAKATGCSISALQKIVKKGEGAYYSSGSRPNQSPQSWGYARLASALTSGKAAAVDYDILEKGCSKRSKALTLAKKVVRNGRTRRRVIGN